MDANDDVVAGVSSDSTVCVWDRQSGALKGKRGLSNTNETTCAKPKVLSFNLEMFYYHRASAWGISILDDNLITGSMDGTIGVIDLKRMKLVKHFKAHDDEWGGEYRVYIHSK